MQLYSLRGSEFNGFKEYAQFLTTTLKHLGEGAIQTVKGGGTGSIFSNYRSSRSSGRTRGSNRNSNSSSSHLVDIKQMLMRSVPIHTRQHITFQQPPCEY
ncbi:Hypothetical predicted protein [Octopus vulgaris]|uniref:Uncharacterized protein n=1 Tax=Octopus vulgaris TaxID=6645 RepID=A0AA36AHQ3_OCTVU|nr:Hypothetical predicted protein [Octopus vulgaris]